MPTARLADIVKYCNAELRHAEFEDYEGAMNGLQVENSGVVTKIAAAVDGSRATVKMAAEAGANLLVVHHGLFWGKTTPWTGPRRALLKLLFDHDMAVYSSHLPLDAHPKLGNSKLLCAALGFKNLRPFFLDRGNYLGLQTEIRIGREELAARLAEVVGRAPIILAGGAQICHRIGVVTGGAGGHVHLASKEGVDTFITGEGPHHTFGQAEDLGLNVFYGGHYATETFGVKALAGALSKKFGVPWEFLDHPSGL